jgi:hypothetical protein
VFDSPSVTALCHDNRVSYEVCLLNNKSSYREVLFLMKLLYLHILRSQVISIRSRTQPHKSPPGLETFPADILWKCCS